MRTDEQILHDKINLQRLMKRLEQSIQEGDWSKSNPPWIKAQAILQVRPTFSLTDATDLPHQQIRYARLLLKNVELDNVDPTPYVPALIPVHRSQDPCAAFRAEERRYQHFGTTLKHLDDYMRQVEQVRPSPGQPFIHAKSD